MTNDGNLKKMMETYLEHVSERNAQGIPPLPLTPEQAQGVCELLQAPPPGEENFLLNLFKERISPGVDPSAKVKADFLGQILKGAVSSPLITKKEAIEILGTMIGGCNIRYLIDALKDPELADDAVKMLSHITLVYDAFDEVLELSKTDEFAKKVIESWAAADWFTSKPQLVTLINISA